MSPRPLGRCTILQNGYSQAVKALSSLCLSVLTYIITYPGDYPLSNMHYMWPTQELQIEHSIESLKVFFNSTMSICWFLNHLCPGPARKRCDIPSSCRCKSPTPVDFMVALATSGLQRNDSGFGTTSSSCCSEDFCVDWDDRWNAAASQTLFSTVWRVDNFHCFV